MVELREIIRRVGPRSLSVLLEGETGTGKELVARALHGESPRRDRPFVPVNCATIPSELAESTLFGHEAGAYTGARGRQRGLLEQADQGTLHLDEVAELPVVLQPKLLRALQEREVVRVGSGDASRPIRIDLRLVAASHHNLRATCKAGGFRFDLYYRIHEYLISLPPLRERGRDALDLAFHFIETGPDPLTRLTRDAEDLILAYPWPGNVRELRSALLAAGVDAPRGRIRATDLTKHLDLDETADQASAPGGPPSRGALVAKELGTRGPSSIGELAEATRIPRTSLRRVLAKLQAAGGVAVSGEGSARRYRLERRAESRDEVGQAAAVQERQTLALNHLRERGSLSRKEYVELTGVSPRTANRDLDDLVARGVIRPDGGKGRAAGYLLA